MPVTTGMPMTNSDTTHFGYKQVRIEDKAQRVGDVFSSVSSNYDLMNDLMSFGVHRFWKRAAIHASAVKKGNKVLDVAGGTCDLALLFHQRLGDEGVVTVTDINSDMLRLGRDKLIDRGIIDGVNYIQADAENLPFKNCYFDCVNIAFGLRNITEKKAALKSMYEKTKYGGCLIILEFSSVVIPIIKQLYDAYSFKLIPLMGSIVANDENSYRYLVESIRMHPDQEALKNMIEEAGYKKVEYHNLSAGIVAIHKAYKI